MPGKIDWRRGRECGQENCKSKLFYEEDGFRFCKRGHQQEGIQTQQDEDDFGVQGRKTRIKRESQENISQIYRGHKATSLYLKAYQFLLWKQCHTLINTIGLPFKLEQLVKNLWRLRLQLVKTDVTTGEETVFWSQAVSEEELENDEQAIDRKWKIRGKAMPTLIETLGLLYLGLVLLRLPISMGEIHRWAVREDIPYIRAVRFVPAIMKQKLPAEYLLALDTTSPLEPDHLRKTIHHLALFYTHHFKLIWPAVNAPLLLYRFIRDLTLPITLHPITLSISPLLATAFTFPIPNRRQQTSSLPELALVSLLVIATKLYHPFNTDKITRCARSLADPAALAIDWSAWAEAQRAHTARLTPEDHLPQGSEINITEKDVMSMTGEKLDEYMDYYERTFVDEVRAESKSRGLPKQLLDMFPTGRPDGSAPSRIAHSEYVEKEQASLSQTLATVMGSLQVRPIASHEDKDDETKPTIGSFYKRYRRVGDLEGPAKFFHEKVAEMVGIKLETLLVAVGQVERKLIVWRDARVKEGVEAT